MSANLLSPVMNAILDSGSVSSEEAKKWLDKFTGSFKVELGSTVSGYWFPGRQTHIVGEDIKLILDVQSLLKLAPSPVLQGVVAALSGGSVSGNVTFTYGQKLDFVYGGPKSDIRRGAEVKRTTNSFFKMAATSTGANLTPASYAEGKFGKAVEAESPLIALERTSMAEEFKDFEAQLKVSNAFLAKTVPKLVLGMSLAMIAAEVIIDLAAVLTVTAYTPESGKKADPYQDVMTKQLPLLLKDWAYTLIGDLMGWVNFVEMYDTVLLFVRSRTVSAKASKDLAETMLVGLNSIAVDARSNTFDATKKAVEKTLAVAADDLRTAAATTAGLIGGIIGLLIQLGVLIAETAEMGKSAHDAKQARDAAKT